MVKLHSLINLFQDQPMSECLIESSSLNHILFLVERIRNQLLDPIDILLLPHKWEIIMEVVQVAVVRYVNLQEVALTPILSQLTDVPLELFWFAHPSEPTSWEALAHHSTVQIICIQVLKVKTLFPRIKSIAHVLVVCPCILMMNGLSNAALCSLHKQHIRVN